MSLVGQAGLALSGPCLWRLVEAGAGLGILHLPSQGGRVAEEVLTREDLPLEVQLLPRIQFSAPPTLHPLCFLGPTLEGRGVLIMLVQE